MKTTFVQDHVYTPVLSIKDSIVSKNVQSHNAHRQAVKQTQSSRQALAQGHFVCTNGHILVAF